MAEDTLQEFLSAQARARATEVAVQSAAEEEETTQQAAAGKKKDEQTRRKVIRPAQKALFSGSVIGAPTLVAFLFGSTTWTTWKGLELYKTVTKKNMGFLDKSLVAWNHIEMLQFIVSAMGLLLIGIVIAGIVGIMGYFIMSPLEASASFPFLTDIFDFLTF